MKMIEAESEIHRQVKHTAFLFFVVGLLEYLKIIIIISFVTRSQQQTKENFIS